MHDELAALYERVDPIVRSNFEDDCIKSRQGTGAGMITADRCVQKIIEVVAIANLHRELPDVYGTQSADDITPLKKLVTQLSKALAAYEELTPHQRCVAEAAAPMMWTPGHARRELRVRELMTELRHGRDRLHDGLGRRTRPAGKPSDPEVRNSIVSAIRLWESATGKPPARTHVVNAKDTSEPCFNVGLYKLARAIGGDAFAEGYTTDRTETVIKKFIAGEFDEELERASEEADV